jgi:putative hydrolase of the HAD superfamily
LTRYKHIFFDLDHTLWDFHANSVEALGEIYTLFDLASKSKSPSSDFFIGRYIHHNERMWSLYRQNRMSKSRLRKARFEAALRDVGLDDKRLAKELGNAYLDICPRKTKLNDDALHVVETLSRRYTLHILSNGFHETQMIKLECSGLKPFFTQVVTSELANARKPQQRMFEFAEVRTGAQKSESLMIGDNVEIDIQGASDFGWDVIHYNEDGEEHDYPSVRRLVEILDLLPS